MMNIGELRKIAREFENEYFGKPNVYGTKLIIREGEPVLLITVDANMAGIFPSEFQGVPVEIIIGEPARLLYDY